MLTIVVAEVSGSRHGCSDPGARQPQNHCCHRHDSLLLRYLSIALCNNHTLVVQVLLANVVAAPVLLSYAATDAQNRTGLSVEKEHPSIQEVITLLTTRSLVEVSPCMALLCFLGCF